MAQEIIPDREEVKTSKLISEIRNTFSALEGALIDLNQGTQTGEDGKIDAYLLDLEHKFSELRYQFRHQKIDEIVYRDLLRKYKKFKKEHGY